MKKISYAEHLKKIQERLKDSGLDPEYLDTFIQNEMNGEEEEIEKEDGETSKDDNRNQE